MKHLIIGICGGTGSGKSTLADRVYKGFKDEAVYIQMDSFYSNRTDLTYEERVTLNYDHPNAFDMDLFVDSVKALKEGQTVTIPQYDFTTHLRKDEWTTVESKSLIILDGILLFADERLFDLIDIKIFVDTDADERILRRAKRDMRDRGRTLESVISQYINTAKPMHDQFVAPFRNRSDVVIPGGGKNEIALEMITSFIRNRLKEQ